MSRLYRFGPLEHRGLLGGVTLAQAITIGLAAAGAAAILDSSPSAPALGAAVMLLVSAVASTRVTIAGHGLASWAVLAGRSVLSSRSANVRLHAGVSPARRVRRGAAAALPRELRGVGLRAVALGDGRAGALTEDGGRRMTLSLLCQVDSFALLDPDAQERRLQAWGTLLTSLGSSPLRRIAWTERTLPARGDELVRWLHDERDPAVPLRGNALIESYLELISGGAQVSQEHQVLVSLQVDARSLRSGRAAGPAETVLAEEAVRVARALEGAELRVLGALSPGQLIRALRTTFDPYAVAELAALDLARGGDGEDGPEELAAALGGAWPLAWRESWDHVRCDGALHATHWISSWPRSDVSPMFLDPLLARTGPVRTVTVCFEPQSIERATRDVEAALTRDQADRVVRARLGQLETARQREVQASALRREAELASGHGEVRFAGFVTVSGRTEAELRHACAQVCDGAARAQLELRRMYGQQGAALAHCLPLCRGLR